MTSFGLKLLALITMAIDHMGYVLFQNNLVFRIIGRLAFPIFAFQLSVGYTHTKNKEKHIFKMILFAIISQIPFMIFNGMASDYEHFLNIGFTFSLALLCMYIIENVNDFIYKTFLLSTVLLLCCFIPIDYGVWGVLLCVSFYIFRNHKYLNLLSAGIIMIFKILISGNAAYSAMLYALYPICLYNDKKGLDNKFSKYCFYIFYPAHMILFALIKLFI